MDTGKDFIFIIGAARSGTKFLRDILNESENVRAVPFDINYVWRYKCEQVADDAIPKVFSNERRNKYISQTIRNLSAKSDTGNSVAILEKTVGNVFRIPFIYSLFPEAKFVHLIRDGRDVAESAARMWDAPYNLRYLAGKVRYFPLRHVRYALWFLTSMLRVNYKMHGRRKIWGPRYPGIVADIDTYPTLHIAAKQWVKSVTYARCGLADVPPHQQIAVFYEDVIHDPKRVDSILDFLKIEDRDRVLKAYHATCRRDTIGKWEALSEREKDILREVETGVLRNLGYTT